MVEWDLSINRIEVNENAPCAVLKARSKTISPFGIFADPRLGGEQQLHAVQQTVLLELEGHVRAEAGRNEAASLQVESQQLFVLDMFF